MEQAQGNASSTPGPWKVRKEWHGDGKEVYPDRKVSIGQPSELCVVSGIYAECAANARLIAAAPDLLEVARVVLFALDGGAGQADAETRRKLLRAAIAKAEGTAS